MLLICSEMDLYNLVMLIRFVFLEWWCLKLDWSGLGNIVEGINGDNVKKLVVNGKREIK